jgi:hypothetical protein
MQLELLESFEIPSVEIPTRSRLVSLEPKGIDTPKCEALISYMTRLAYKHVVRPHILVKSIIVPMTDLSFETSLSSFSYGYSRTINSYVNYAARFSNALEKLTQRANLKNLTLLPWRDLLDPKGSGLLRDHVGICPMCLDEFDQAGSEIYYPLLWYLRATRICSSHQCHLEDTCSACGKCQAFVAPHAMLGYCTHCGAWLGTPAISNTSTKQTKEISIRDKFMTAAIEQIVANNSRAEQIASRELLVARVDQYCEVLSDGKMSFFEKDLGFSRHMIANWKNKMIRPRMETFLELCFRLQKMPLQLLTEEISSEVTHINKYLNKTTSKPKVKLSHEELRTLRERLIGLLESDPPLSQPEISEALGIKLRFLLYHFPDLCRQAAKRRRQVISINTAHKRAEKIKKTKEITENMLSEPRPISRRKIGKALEKQGLPFADAEIRRAALEVLDKYKDALTYDNHSQKEMPEPS